MNYSDFKKGQIYTRDDLVSAFGGSFLRPRGITPLNSLNLIVLISFHTGRSRYIDKISDNDITLYTGEGQNGDQTLTGRNRTIYTAKENGKKILLFVVRKSSQYTYYGEMELVDEPFYSDEPGFDGQIRKAIKFPLMQRTVRRLTEYEMSHAYVGGITPLEKPIVRAVGAAIINKNGEILCAQRGYGSLIGKWEFPGGKIEDGETDQQALIREIKEELDIDIEVGELIDESYNEYPEQNVYLKVFKCKQISGVISDKEHKALKWLAPNKTEELDWAEADKPILNTYLDSLPRRISGDPLLLNYYEAEAVESSDRDIMRAVQDYEKSQRAKQKSGNQAEEAVLHYERDKLNNLGRPDLADMVRRVSKDSSDHGYDILSFKLNNGVAQEVHIEVKSAKLSNAYIEFFISQNELNKFKKDPAYKIYCLIRIGRDYKLHEVKRADFFAHNYLIPMTYRVRIRIAE